MRVLSLDLSTSTGWSVFEDGKMLNYGAVKVSVVGKADSKDYPLNIIEASKSMANQLYIIGDEYKVDQVVIEETNLGKNRYSQKILEFIHCMVCIRISEFAKISYMDSSEWRAILQIYLSSDQRKNNKQIKQYREDQKQILIKEWWNNNIDSFEKDIIGLKKRSQNKIKKEYDLVCSKHVLVSMRKFKTKSKKINFKHLSVSYTNDNYKLNLKMKDDDIADSICINEAFYKKITGEKNE